MFVAKETNAKSKIIVKWFRIDINKWSLKMLARMKKRKYALKNRFYEFTGILIAFKEVFVYVTFN